MSQPRIHKDSICAVVGYGSWATAIVKILLENGSTVRWHVRNPDVKAHLSLHRTNPKYLSQVHFFTDRLTVTDDIRSAVRDSDVIIFAVPSAFLGLTLEPLDKRALDGKFIVSAIKGIVPDGYLTVAEWFNRRYGVPFDRIGIVTGPCHAEEVALERLSYLTMVCKDPGIAEQLGAKFANDYIRVTTSADIYGAEYAAVLKNIYAIAVGIAHGIGYGDNFLAVLISNAALEMERFLTATFAAERNVCNSAYLGDLLVTCYSQFSRNRTFGVMIGKGYSVRNAQMEMNMIAEGYYAADCIHRLRSRFGIGMPIAEAVYRILYERKSPAVELKSILDQLK
ncbi:MAG: NAD(P)H-dependent glycerol-3-phosphate dehydrogenase [Rikenellaceae bacterium]|nr:NAD(P)H-dependent glycerol-3-phosphate dehydrogenase [Rikenellaceae bacterium]